jgi:hypothetical protein
LLTVGRRSVLSASSEEARDSDDRSSEPEVSVRKAADQRHPVKAGVFYFVEIEQAVDGESQGRFVEEEMRRIDLWRMGRACDR